MVELVDTQVLGTCDLRRGGSSPSARTIISSASQRGNSFGTARLGT